MNTSGDRFHELRCSHLPSPEENAKRRYTQGRCGEFARALSQLTLWPEMMVCADGVSCHVVVQRPDGLYLDVEGLSDQVTLLKRWNEWGNRMSLELPDPNLLWTLNRAEILVARDYILDHRKELLTCPTLTLASSA